MRRLVVITDALRCDLYNAYAQVDKRQIVVAPDGVDIERFTGLPDAKSARRRLELEITGCLAGYAGHFYEGKGIELIVRLAKMCPDINFLLIGGEPVTVSVLRDELARSGISNVFLTGFVANAELPRYLAACDILLLPNQSRVSGSSGGNIGRYTSPLKLFEYLASGKAIISSDLPVLREILNPAVAVLVPPQDEERWAGALRELCEKTDVRESLGEAANRYVHRFSWQNRVSLILDGILGE